MKLIIVDDTVENLTAAKKAANDFPEHEFVFTNSAAEAIKMLPSADGVITDLFFHLNMRMSYYALLTDPSTTR